MVGHLDQRDRENLVRLYIVSVQLDTEGIVEQLIRMGAASRDVDRPALDQVPWPAVERDTGAGGAGGGDAHCLPPPPAVALPVVAVRQDPGHDGRDGFATGS